MKHTKWLGAGLCAALVACTAAPPRDARPDASIMAAEPERAASAEAASPAPVASAAKPPSSPPVAITSAPPPAPAAIERPSAARPVAPAKAVPATSTKPAPTKPVASKPTPVPAPAASKPAAAVARAPVAAPAAAVRSLAGRVELVGSARQAVAAGEAADGVVYFLPKAGTTRPRPASASVDTHSKGFLPSSVVVPVGSTIAFPNRDEILHNVYSATPGTTFDLGTYGPGQTRSARFAKPGLVLVACNVHIGMRANVLVLDTPHYTRPGRDGRFELKNLPAGPGTLVFWHPRTAPLSRPVTAPATALTARLTAVRARVGAN